MNTVQRTPSPQVDNGWDRPEFDDASERGFSIDFATIRGILWRQRFTLSITAMAVILLGFVFTLLMTPIYTATATVKLDPKPVEIIEGQNNLTLNGRDMITYKATLAEVIKSRSMAQRVAQDPRLIERLGPPDSKKPEGMSPKNWQDVKINTTIDQLRNGVRVDPLADLNIMSISYSSTDAGLSAMVANAYVDGLLTDDIQRSLEQSEYSRRYLANQINDLQNKLSNAERQTITYARAARFVPPGIMSSGTVGAPSASASGRADSSDHSSAQPAPSQTVPEANLAALTQAYNEARNQRIAAEQRWNTVANAPNGSLTEVQQNAMIQSLVAQRTTAAAQLADLRTRYGEAYPQASELKAQIGVLDKQIQQLGDEIKRSLRGAYQTALNQENALSAEVSKASAQTLDEQTRRVQFGQFEREASAYRNQLDNMLARYNELSASANIKPSTISRLDNAQRPARPTSPNIAKNMLITVALALALAITVAVLFEFFDDRLRSIADLEDKLKLPTLGITPLVSGFQNLETSTVLYEAYSSARVSLEFALPQRDHVVIAFTSSQSGEGKSTTAFMMGKELAGHGRKVLLIDTDLRKPSIAIMAGRDRQTEGLADVLLGTVSPESALIPIEGTGLSVLPAGTVSGPPIDILSSPIFAQYLKHCAEEYSVVLLDSPPVMGLADAPVIACLADATVFVIEANRSHFGQAKAALRRLRDSGAHVVGAVLTKFVPLSAGQSYDYQYSYYTYGDD